MHKRFLYALIPPLEVSSLSVEPYVASCNKASIAQNIFLLKNQLGGVKLETGEVAKKLLETLVTVRHSTIARWNEHKDVKEDKER